MAGLCKNTNRGSAAAGVLGIALMIAGVVLLLAAVPRWVWCAAVAVFVIALGYVIWRFVGRR